MRGFSLFIVVTFLILAALMVFFLRMIRTNFDGFYHVEFVTEKYQMEIRKDVQVINKRLLGVLVKAATEIAKGDVHVDIDYHKQNEIGMVADQLRKAMGAIAQYIDDISRVMSMMAAGQFNVRFSREFDGDFKAIQDAVNSFTRDISDSMRAITEVSATVSDSSTQMAEGSQSLANGTTRQASAIEEISATIQDVSAQIATTADNATQAGRLSEKTQEKVNYQDAEIQNMVSAMNEISDTSKEIEKIIKTIEDIAFQTNILALNAAVEAARAGAAGKGFAVVADEVRNLATKSQEAAQSTSDLITAAINAVGKGSEIADATAESMKEVKEMSLQTAKLIVDIAEATQGQSDSIKQITAGVEQVSEVIQTNAATAEETSALCSSLNGQSNQLHERVATFELRE